ncbi:hypothetical protein AVEN_164272-1 [Araneus ventricosus]|uniref:Uncharacterized protein n=1 Tax=Araneus ventricosus TaxID=182803 RepID=A0A4Y2X6J8_ARAVE|nr:hypothetical protein AVEN_164272-1 [Araneus ventricosus]
MLCLANVCLKSHCRFEQTTINPRNVPLSRGTISKAGDFPFDVVSSITLRVCDSKSGTYFETVVLLLLSGFSRYLKFQICLHDEILEICGEGREKLADYISKDMTSRQEYCRGCVSTISNHWILDLLTFFSVILRLKFLY